MNPKAVLLGTLLSAGGGCAAVAQSQVVAGDSPEALPLEESMEGGSGNLKMLGGALLGAAVAAGVMLATRAADGDQTLVPWVPAVVADGEAWLFEPAYGMAIPGPGGEGIATARQAFEDRRRTMQVVILAILLALGAGGLGVAGFRRSSRAYYALVMGGGMLVLISSLWMRGLVASLGFEDAVLPYRLDYARGALISMLVMTAISQVNMLLRKTTNRNYWTRVVIIGDFCLLAAGLSGLAAVWQPDFAGLISNDISEVLLAVTCACVFLGAIFVPDQRRVSDEVPEQTGSDG